MSRILNRIQHLGHPCYVGPGGGGGGGHFLIWALWGRAAGFYGLWLWFMVYGYGFLQASLS